MNPRRKVCFKVRYHFIDLYGAFVRNSLYWPRVSVLAIRLQTRPYPSLRRGEREMKEFRQSIPLLWMAIFGVILMIWGMWLGTIIENGNWRVIHHVNHPEGSEMHPVYLKGSKLYMDHKLFLRAVQCAKTPDACQDVEQLDYPAERVLGGRK